MAKKKILYECMACGYESPRWLGKCPNCGAWNQMEEVPGEILQTQSVIPNISNRDTQDYGSKRLDEIHYQTEDRIHTEFQEFDRVLGGGVVAGSLVLIGGDPGIGKSTLLLQVAMQLAQKQRILYVSGEESLSQIKMRADRIGVNDSELYLISETNMEVILNEVNRVQPAMLIIDSVQTMTIPDHQGVAGSVSQVRETTAWLMKMAKQHQIAVFLVGHVTKEGSIAGPRMLEHMVDTVLYFEGDQHHRFRILRGVKNRFGSTHELGVFEMLEDGLREVVNPSEVFLEERIPNATGSTVVAALEGTRTILAQVQSLMTPTVYGNAKRTASGIDYQRISLLLAVMEKHCHLLVQNQDAFFKITGGIKLDEPAIDLAIAVSIASSYWNQSVPVGDVFIGEIGLTGEIRRVSQVKERIQEAQKLGFKRVFIPYNNLESLKGDFTMEIIGVRTIAEMIHHLFPDRMGAPS